jgi:two-component sensor histidine kinase
MTLTEIQQFGWLHLLPKEDREPTKEQWMHCVRTGEDFQREHRFRAKDGTIRYVLAIGRLVRDEEGGITGWVGVNLDIDERKKAENEIESSLKEKEVLLKEIHHRVKNNMQIISSLVSLQADQSKDSTIREILQDVSNRVRSMAIVHEKLYQSTSLAWVELVEYTESLVNHLWRSYGGESSNIHFTKDLEPISLPVNEAVPWGLILNELVSNALKHAFPGVEQGEVAVSLHNDDQGQVVLNVRDNGQGLPSGFDWSKTDSLGLRLVKILAAQLHAQVQVISDGGTEFKVTFRSTNT